MNKADCALYIASCDAYSDVWPGFFKQLQRNWPDCPFKLYLGTNSKDFLWPNLTCLKSDEAMRWSDRVKSHINQIETEYILLFLEDWYISKPVCTKEIINCFSQMKKLGGKMLRLVPDPPPNISLPGYPEIGMMGIGVMNRINTHATIWRKQTLIEIMADGETVWEFEVNGAARSNIHSGGIFCAWNRKISYDGVVDKGKWTRFAINKYRHLNDCLDFHCRGTKSIRETIIWRGSKAIADLIRIATSHRARQILKNRFAKTK
jgi:hypothetical protein